MDQYSVFFTFYRLILGLAVTEILSNFSAYGRHRLMRSIEPQSALLAALTFLVICATWIDAWTTRTDFGLSFARMWAPIGAATSYFLAASAVLPKDESDYDNMAAYFMRRKTFVVGMLILAELFIKVTYLPTFSRSSSSPCPTARSAGSARQSGRLTDMLPNALPTAVRIARVAYCASG